jgi:hypothetical protein
MTNLEPDIVNRAIVAWLGYEDEAVPVRDEDRVVRALGATLAAQAMPVVRALEDEFYASNARHVAPDLPAMARQASAEFSAREPEVSELAVTALAWAYTFDYK